jgi:hypothetical protein
MSVMLVLPKAIGDRIGRLLERTDETGAVLHVRRVESEDRVRLLGVRMDEVPEEAYIKRGPFEMKIASEGYVPALRVAEDLGTIPLWLHTHPGEHASPQPSMHDEQVDEQLRDVFQLRSGADEYGAVIFAGNRDDPRFTGHLDRDDGARPIDSVLVVGARFRLVRHDDHGDGERNHAMYDRSVRAFGGHVQRVLGDLHVAVVGCGGTGSAVVEQLVRLGVRHLVLIDPDCVSESNLTRLYGSAPPDVGKPKVEVVGSHARRLAPDVRISTVQRMVTEEAAALALVGADVIFGCTDDNAGRMVLSRASTFLLAPVIDCGVVLESDDEHRLRGIHGRVTVLHPGAACLVCRGRIDLGRAASEVLTPTERRRRVDEGYAPALHDVEPAVVAYTTAVAAAAVGELLERLVGYGDDDVPSEVLLRLHDREVSTNIAEPRSKHYCHPDSGKIGLGVTEPFLEQMWPE